jgi:hypothetical protein
MAPAWHDPGLQLGTRPGPFRFCVFKGNDDDARSNVDFGLEWLFGFNSRILRMNQWQVPIEALLLAAQFSG